MSTILFDDDARRDFLTGFHKRKKARLDAARNRALQRQKLQRLQARRERRRALRDQAAENTRQVQSFYGSVDHQDEWLGIHAKHRDQAYEDDQALATVTVVEDFDPDTLRHGPHHQQPQKVPSPSQHPKQPPNRAKAKKGHIRTSKS